MAVFLDNYEISAFGVPMHYISSYSGPFAPMGYKFVWRLNVGKLIIRGGAEHRPELTQELLRSAADAFADSLSKEVDHNKIFAEVFGIRWE